MYQIRWRRDFIIPLTFLVTLGVLGLVLFQIDRQYYQQEKFEIIRDDRENLIPFDREELRGLIEAIVKSPANSEAQKLALERLEAASKKLLESDSPVYRLVAFSALDPQRPFFDMRVDKFRTHNTWKNSLFLRDFSKSSDILVTEDYRGGRAIGRYVLQHTTPLTSPKIEVLTIRWRWRCLMITIAFFALYGAILKGILLPVRRVIACLEREDQLAPELLKRPGSLLERAYNNLARDACLTKLAARLRDRIAADPALDPRQLLARIPEDLKTFFGFRGITFWTLRADEGGSLWTLEDVRESPNAPMDSDNREPLAEFLKREVAEAPPRPGSDSTPQYFGSFRNGRGESLWCFAGLVDRRRDPETVTLFVATAEKGRSAAPTPWWRDTYRLAADQVRVAFENLTAQRRIILQEKSKANISLSRNLGHDLTNIIATGKLDLMTVRRFLNLAPEEWKKSPQKEEIYRISLNALLNNSRLLQETVNIYRSFSYLSRPKFEQVDMRQLATEVVELFRLSLSRRIQVEMALSELPATCVIEPRLVKLALFNLLTNAADAIKRKSNPDAGDTEDQILVSVRKENESGEVCLAVADTGTGILTRDGQPAPAAEMERIFQLGYSTKEREEGEGLGLNWVHTIIAEFHGGRVIPRNRPEGGAEMSVYLRADSSRDVEENDAPKPDTDSANTLRDENR